jgi:ATP-dependent DNA ligase
MKTEKITTKPPFPELRGKLAAVVYPALSEIKYDGEYTLVVYVDKGDTVECRTLNKYGKTRTMFPAIDKIAHECRNAGVKEATFLAELYTDEGKLGALYDLLGRKEDDTLSVSIFDAVTIVFKEEMLGEYEDISPTTPLIDRKETIMNILPSQRQHIEIVTDESEARAHFEQVTKDGYEGTVIKTLDGKLVMGPCTWVKMKYKDQSDYPIVEIDAVKERVTIGVPHPPHGLVKVGVKVMNDIKQTLNVGDLITIEHQGVLPSGSLRHAVFKGKV